MENQYSGSSFEIRLNENLKTQLKGAAQWAGITGTLLLVSGLVGVISAFLGKKPTADQYEAQGVDVDPAALAAVETVTTVFVVLIYLIFYSIAFYFLNRFASKIKAGLISSNSQQINEGMGGFSGYFIYMGVLLILMLALLFFGVLLAVAVGVTR